MDKSVGGARRKGEQKGRAHYQGMKSRRAESIYSQGKREGLKKRHSR